MDLKHKGIGIFDSGLGGLTVLKEIKKILSNERLIYIGDTARVPYGNRSPSTIIRYSLENSNFLIKMGIKLLVIACNTASALSLNILRGKFSIPIIGVIEPGAIKAVKITKNRKIGVIGTTGTINSRAYIDIINRMDSYIEVYSKACPLFVPLAEEGLIDDHITLEIAERYLKDLKRGNIDTLILGCTHYPILKGVIKEVMGNVNLIDSAEEVAKIVYSILDNNSILNDNEGSMEIYVTDIAPQFIDIGERFLGMDIKGIKKVELNEEEF